MPPSTKQLRRKLINVLPNLVPIAVYSLHVFLAPYTKVEESFTLHAIHDVLAHGLSPTRLQHWDHVAFPGAVPRSFMPAILIGLLSYPLAALSISLGWVKTRVDVQILVRLILAVVSAHCFNHLSRTLRQRYGASVRLWFVLLSMTQFHIPFYAGRTLPNFMALPFVTLSFSLILRSGISSIPAKVSSARIRKSIILLTATATIIRLELAALLLPIVLSLLMFGRLTLETALIAGTVGGIGSLLVCSPFDLILWRPTLTHPDFPFDSYLQLIWPEATSLWYNLFLGKASDWGESPWWYYLVNALPKISLSSLPLAGLGMVLWFAGALRLIKPARTMSGAKDVMESFLLGGCCLVLVMSCIGHKEWRFVVYVVPIFNIVAAFTADYLWQFPWRRLRPLARVGLVGLVCLNLAFTALSTYISAYNYPGGQVWRILHSLPMSGSKPVIHYTNYPLQTGASLFTFTHIPLQSRALPLTQNEWTYSKSEDQHLETPSGALSAGLDYVVLDANLYSSWEDTRDWHVVGTVQGLGKWRRIGKWMLGMDKEIKIYVMGRADGDVRGAGGIIEV
ncbi:Alg9-like mannosyltransferase family-domain-containing protein [Kockovaella imperatae]|uniref:Mannosyltransferase n=1 Tax=Kockovaella imperatae TaxID=4999 RepID=A0A1Y1UEJ1_9TREE|nr:Alg9-like mannosyltransferase family-domain-containing protein [Kockovaella imperatae]ORX35947.1 Alg9-like mannosyltransferase family-domain-containing protein [Kockovaella imperatae]